jgi:2,3-bisphosphoglycerate-independent phosphoglycerate mutase
MKKHILIILDGYGIAKNPAVSAIDRANKPFLDQLFAKYPHGTLEASGLPVGLPKGQMGNSEVGHTNLGAGRIVYQDITRIDKEIEDKTFFENEVLKKAFQHALQHDSHVHLLGLLSDGGVHSSLEHVKALLDMAKQQGLSGQQVCLHAFTDGRDTDPRSSIGYVEQFQAKAAETGVGYLASIVGRYYAMDRDNRWERVAQAYDLLVHGAGTKSDDALAALHASHEAGITDEFVKPILVVDADGASPRIQPNDAVICFNFRSDRMREITKPLIFEDFSEFSTVFMENLYYITFTPYDSTFHVPVAFDKVDLVDTLGEVVSRHGLKQLRAAETEKYPHVTFFFNGGREEPFEGEDRILVASPKVATYDLQPEMSAPELSHKVAEAIRLNDYSLVVLNFAQTDMVGHTGIMEAAIKAVEAADKGCEVVVTAALESGYSVEIIADHGNCDKMINEDGSPNTAHTTAFVPHLLIIDGFDGKIKHGKLGDIAPTILHILGIEIPARMTGEVLI